MPRFARAEVSDRKHPTQDQVSLLEFIWSERERTGSWPQTIRVRLEFDRRGKNGRALIDVMPGGYHRKDTQGGKETLHFDLDAYALIPLGRRVLDVAARVLGGAAARLKNEHPTFPIVNGRDVAALSNEQDADARLVRTILRDHISWFSNWQDKGDEGWLATADYAVLQYFGVADGETLLRVHHARYIPTYTPGIPHRQLMREVLRSWRSHGVWPEYRRLSLDYIDKGYVPRLVNELHERFMRKDTTGEAGIERVILNLRGLAATAEAQEELDAFVRVLAHMIERFKASDGDLQLSAGELSHNLRLSTDLSRRVVQLFDREHVGAYVVDRTDWILKIEEHILAYQGLMNYTSFARKRGSLPSNFDRARLSEAILDTFHEASISGYPHLTHADLLSRPGWCGDLECHLGSPLLPEENALVEDLLFELADKKKLQLLGAPNEKGEVLFSRPDRVEPESPISSPSSAGKTFQSLRDKLNPPQEQFSCLRCGKLSLSQFEIGPDDRALCPECTDLKRRSASSILNEGLAPELAADVRFGNFMLQECVGSGSYGSVWKAIDVSLGRTVALKFPLVQEGETLARFKSEAMAAASLEHPNIARIYSVAEDKGRSFIVMQFIDGEPLAPNLAKTPREAGLLFRKIASAVAFAHQKGILHRDVKPGNILVDVNGTPYVTDFGLARDVNQTERMTATGVFIGTPGYAAPEQANGKAADHRSDVYSLGAVLYELVVGVPYADDDSNKTFDGDKAGLVRIARKCLERLPINRFQTSQEVVDELDAYLEKPRSAAFVSGESIESPRPAPQAVGISSPSGGTGVSSSWDAKELERVVLAYFRERQAWCAMDGAALEVDELKTMGKRTVDLIITCLNCGRTASHKNHDGASREFSIEQVGVIRSNYFGGRDAACPFDGSLLNVTKLRTMGEPRAAIIATCPYCGAEGSDR